MTLHWWMHWFWVTAQIVASLTSPTSELSSNRTIDQVSPIIPSSPPSSSSALSNGSSLSGVKIEHMPNTAAMLQQQQHQDTLARLQQNYRIAKAIGIQAKQMTVESSVGQAPVDTESDGNHWVLGRSEASTEDYGMNRSRLSTPNPHESIPASNASAVETYDNKTTKPLAANGSSKKESKITWVNAFSKAPKLRYEETPTTSPSILLSTRSSSSNISNSSESTLTAMSEEQLTVMPLHHDDDHDPNAIRKEQMVVGKAPSDDLLLGVETVEPRIVATAASVLDAAAGLSDSTRLGRARGTFTSEFHREQLSRDDQQQQQHAHHAENKVDTTIKEAHDNRHANVTEIATITGSCLAVIVLLSTVGSLGFIMYRRRYLNPPQTLNSDKCSNPDSSGYIDDSTIRDNSEEMYSLDNDSFLNSLEAMTIQNYWTDSVKHTKL